jgi:dienelactone hydrolase
MQRLPLLRLPGRILSSKTARTIFTLGLALASGFVSWAGEASSLDVLTPVERDQLFQVYFKRMTAPKALARFKTRGEWNAYQSELKGKILHCLGLSPLPERIPLSPVITGKLDRDGYSVERVYYQVFPKVYASGYLYRPRGQFAGENPAGGAGARLPAVLNPHGHWTLGAVDPTVQMRCIALALKGYIAFCPDSTHVADLGVGLCPIGLMTWNNMRALDYLESLDCVDKTRLGCTGESGGGQQTLYLAALDERVKVIVPAVLVSYFQRILFVSEQTHCFCNHAPGIAGLTDEHEMAAMFAPRPALFICATGDWTKDFPKVEFPEIRHIYNLVGGDVDCVQFDKPHNYDRDSREQMYAWMNKYLNGESDPAQAKEPPFTAEPPEVLKALSKQIPGASDLEGARAYYRSRFTFHPVQPQGKAQWHAFQKQTKATLRELLGESVSPDVLASVSRRTTEIQGLRPEKILLHTEREVIVPAWLFLPERKGRHSAAVVIVHPAGKHALLSQQEDLVRALLLRGIIVFAVDPRFRGELQRNWHWNEVIWGRPEEGTAAHDLNGAGAYLRSRKEVDPDKVFLLGLGEAGRFALCAGTLDPHWAGIAMDDVGPSYADSDVLQVIPHLLRHGDLPQLAALIAPRPLWINGARSRFGFTQDCYRALGKPTGLYASDLQANLFTRQLPAWLVNPRLWQLQTHEP